MGNTINVEKEDGALAGQFFVAMGSSNSGGPGSTSGAEKHVLAVSEKSQTPQS